MKRNKEKLNKKAAIKLFAALAAAVGMVKNGLVAVIAACASAPVLQQIVGFTGDKTVQIPIPAIANVFTIALVAAVAAGFEAFLAKEVALLEAELKEK